MMEKSGFPGLKVLTVKLAYPMANSPVIVLVELEVSLVFFFCL